MRCLTSRAVLETLEAAPEEAVTPAAAVFALKRVAALEQGVKRRRKAGSFTVAAAEDNDFLRCVNRDNYHTSEAQCSYVPFKMACLFLSHYM